MIILVNSLVNLMIILVNSLVDVMIILVNCTWTMKWGVTGAEHAGQMQKRSSQSWQIWKR